MAIYPNPSAFPHYNNLNASPSQPISIEAWTEQATQSLNAVSLVSPSDAQSPSVTLAIGLDEQSNTKQVENTGSGGCAGDASRRREPMRRDSLKRRETLLKGKEGSRRRRQWENGSYHDGSACYGSSC